jgi:hypothetical protein
MIPRPGTTPGVETAGESARHGPVAVTACPAVHQKTHATCSGWEDIPPRGEYPVIEGTLIRLAAPARPGPGPMWLRASGPGRRPGPRRRRRPLAGLPAQVRHRSHVPVPQNPARLGQGHAPRPRRRRPPDLDPAHPLHPALARPPPHRRHPPAPAAPPPPGTTTALTPGQVRTGFRVVRAAAGTPASHAKPATPGPGPPQDQKTSTKPPATPPARKTRPGNHARHASKKVKRQG